MTEREFALAADAHRIAGKIRSALHRVLVSGESAYAAALATGVTQGGISRARKRLERPVCPACRQEIKR